MNKLTKQLLSLGLSAVTVAGMVTPVLADDEVPTTTEPETSEVANQPTEDGPSNEIVMKSITLQITKDGQTTSTTFDVDVNATDDYVTSYIVANCVPEGYRIDGKGAVSSLCKVSDNEWQMVLVKKEEQKPEVSQVYNLNVVYKYENKTEQKTFTVDDGSDDVYSYIQKHFIPEGYSLDSYWEKDPTTRTYEIEICKYQKITYQVFVDGLANGEVSDYNMPAVYTNKQIEECLARYVMPGYDFVKTTQKGNHWNVYFETPKKDNENFTLIINKDGKETESKITISKADQIAYGNIEQYLVINYLPDGYHIDDDQYGTKGIFSIGTNVFKMYLAKNENSSKSKTFTLVLTKFDQEYNPNTTLEGATVEYHTFEFDSSMDGILEYMTKKYLPKGYMWQSGAAADTEVFRFAAHKLNQEYGVASPKIYSVEFLDSETNEKITSNTHTLFLYGEDRNTVNASELGEIPKGYTPVKDSYKVVEENGNLVVKAYLKKGEYQIPVSVKFLEEQNGKLVSVKPNTPFKKSAQEFDLNKNGSIDQNEIQKYIPEGYCFIGFYPRNFTFGEFYASSLNLEYVLVRKSSIVESEESKNIASIQNKDVTTILTDSLTKDQKKKVEAALNDGKNVDFKPILKNGVNKSDEKVLLAYVDDNKYNVVNAFDVEIQLYVDDKNEGLITETSKELTFKVAIPESLKKEGRKFYVLRAHDGKVEKLPVNEDGTFETDKFSSYMLVYEDVKATTSETKPEVKPETNTETNPTVKPEIKPAAKPNTGLTTNTTDAKKNNTVKKDVKKNKKVNTSTKTSSTLFTGLLGVSIVGLGVVEVLRRRNK